MFLCTGIFKQGSKVSLLLVVNRKQFIFWNVEHLIYFNIHSLQIDCNIMLYYWFFGCTGNGFQRFRL